MYQSSGVNFSSPDNNIKYLNLEPQMVVADFGVGSGAYAMAAAREVPGGKVYAIDIQKDLLAKLKKEASHQNLNNIEILWGDIENVGGVKLTDNSADVVIVSNVLFQAEAKYQLALEAKRILKPAGRLLFIDWSESFGGLGPQAGDIVTAEEAEKIFSEAGFNVSKSFPAGPHHYGIIFVKK